MAHRGLYLTSPRCKLRCLQHAAAFLAQVYANWRWLKHSCSAVRSKDFRMYTEPRFFPCISSTFPLSPTPLVKHL